MKIPEGVLEKVAGKLWEKHKSDMGSAFYDQSETWKGVPESSRLSFYEEAQAAITAAIESGWVVEKEKVTQQILDANDVIDSYATRFSSGDDYTQFNKYSDYLDRYYNGDGERLTKQGG